MAKMQPLTRYHAERYDADGKFYVFDRDQQGSEVAGPFDTIEEADAALTRIAQAAAGNPPVTFATEEPTMGEETARRILSGYAPPDTFLQFIRALVEAGLLTTDEFVYFLEKPWKWAEAFRQWNLYGRPLDASDAGWEAWLEAVE